MAYEIGDVSKALEVSPQSLRMWEKLGLIPKPRRSLTNRRRYTDKDLESIKQFLNQKNRP